VFKVQNFILQLSLKGSVIHTPASLAVGKIKKTGMTELITRFLDGGLWVPETPETMSSLGVALW
jgi:hypothetical protein